MGQVAGGKSLPEQAAEKINQYIEDMELTVGDKLPNEFQLAEICEVGRSTIREAIKLLIFAGRVEVVRGSGTYITEPKEVPAAQEVDEDPMGLQEVDEEEQVKTALEYFDVRLLLEPEVAAMAASNATYLDCQKLLAIQKEVEKNIESGKDHLQTDIDFHNQIAACTHSHVICNLMGMVVKGIPVFIKITRNSVANTTLDQHRAITEAITSGDAVGARCAMIEHLNSNRKKILDVMAEEKK